MLACKQTVAWKQSASLDGAGPVAGLKKLASTAISVGSVRIGLGAGGDDAGQELSLATGIARAKARTIAGWIAHC